MFLSLILAVGMTPTDTGSFVAQTEDRSRPLAPAGNPGHWATNDDYPVRAMVEEREGTSGFRLTVGADGAPTGCEIIAPSGHADLDEATCRLLLERARFTPGLDAGGKPVGGTYTNRIRWQIPGREDGDQPGFSLASMMRSWPRGALPSSRMMELDPAEHYPAAALAARAEGTVHMALNIDVEGKVVDCTVTATSASDALDAAACALMRAEGEFAPALDSDGKPTRATFVAEYRWELPAGEDADGTELADALGELPGRRRDFPLRDPGHATLKIIINSDGSVGDCEFVGSGQLGAVPEAASPCAIFGGDNLYAPFLDANGAPVARRVILRSELAVEEVAVD